MKITNYDDACVVEVHEDLATANCIFLQNDSLLFYTLRAVQAQAIIVTELLDRKL